MYNRYIPQPDGSFQRTAIPEPEIQPEVDAAASVPAEDRNTVPPITATEQPTQKRSHHPNTSYRSRPTRQPPNNQNTTSVSQFLRNLLPKGFDTEDLIVVLLLLLISGNSSGDQNAALLTLGIYLFM